ncbi:hypothetical protein ACSBR1_025068 [Camellia fascicularis]
MTGKYATPATNELGIQIRTLCPMKDVKSWLDLDETTKSAVIQAILVTDITCPEDVAKTGQELDFPKFYEDSHTSKKTNDWIHPKCRELHEEMVNVQAATIESGTSLTQEELSRQVLGQKKRYLLGFGSGPLPSTIAASRAHDKDMEAMRAEVEPLRAE